MKMAIQKANLRLADCLEIRRIVFVEGQNVDSNLELDGHDESSDHYLLEVDGNPVGTARVRHLGSTAKIQRVAVLDSFRGQGLGKELMNFMLNDIRHSNHTAKVILSSQTHAVAFYEKLGFIARGAEFLEAGIPHRDMELFITTK